MRIFKLGCPEPEKSVSQLETGSGRSSNDGGGFAWMPLRTRDRSDPLPARSDGLDNVDGGPDAAFYIQIGIIQQVCIFCRL